MNKLFLLCLGIISVPFSGWFCCGAHEIPPVSEDLPFIEPLFPEEHLNGSFEMLDGSGVPQGWHKYIGDQGGFVGIEGRFGASAPYKVLADKYGLTTANVVQQALALLGKG